MMTRYRLYWPLVWALLFVVFLSISLPIVGRAVLENRVGPAEPNHSVDNYLQGLTGVANGSEHFAVALATLPVDKPLVVFVNEESSPSTFLGMLVAYLSWPRDVRIVKVRSATLERDLALIQPASIAGVVLCSIGAPTRFPGQIQFGSNIVIVPASGLASSR